MQQMQTVDSVEYIAFEFVQRFCIVMDNVDINAEVTILENLN